MDRIYVMVPLEGELQVAQGGVFSYYEFPQPRSNRLTDEQWRERLASTPPRGPAWVTKFRLSGGEPVDQLAFRIGDIYLITEEGENLNVRINPSLNDMIVAKLQPGTYVELIDGPVNADGYTWWKYNLLTFDNAVMEGWAVEHQDWYERAWGQ